MKIFYSLCLFSLLSISVFSQFSAIGQLSDSIVGMTLVNGSLHFCKIDITSGNVTICQSISNGLTSTQSSCVDNNHNLYYFCEGNLLKEINPSSGKILSTTTLFFNSSVNFMNIRFNPCDSMIYGFIKNGSGCSFAKYSPLTTALTTISPIAGTATPPWGALGYIDSDSGYYVSHTGHGIATIDIHTGQVKYSTLIVNPPNESFGHLAFNCNTREALGISVNSQSLHAMVTYLSRINLLNGQVTHVSHTGWPIGSMSLAAGGQCINQITSDYYYSSRCGATLIESNRNGFIINAFITPNEFAYIEHFSSCTCNTEKTTDISQPEVSNKSYLDYLNGELHINSLNSEVIVYDMMGKLIFKRHVDTPSIINTDYFAKGAYFFRVTDKSGIITEGKFFK